MDIGRVKDLVDLMESGALEEEFDISSDDEVLEDEMFGWHEVTISPWLTALLQ